MTYTATDQFNKIKILILVLLLVVVVNIKLLAQILTKAHMLFLSLTRTSTLVEFCSTHISTLHLNRVKRGC